MAGYIAAVFLLILFAGITCCVLAVLGFLRSTEALRKLRTIDRDLSALREVVAAATRRLNHIEAGEQAAEPISDAREASPALAASRPTATPAIAPVDRPETTAVPPAEWPETTAARVIEAARAGAAAPTGPGAERAQGTMIRPSAPASLTSPVVERPKREETLESQIGGQWFLFVGAAVLVLGVGFFVKFAFDNHWIDETARVIIGGLIGLALAGGGAWFVRREYRLYGQILTGAGYAVIFISLYAAFAFYGLIDRMPAFLLFAATAAAAALSADHFDSPGLALMAIVGGFITPFLIGGDTDAQVTLLGYDALLVAGTMFLAHRRSWPLLNLASFLLTGVTFFGWATRWYTPAKFLPTEIFLVLFCAMFLYVLVEAGKKHDENSRVVTKVLWAGPVVFHIASLNNLFQHSEALLVYLSISSAIVVAASARAGRPWVRLIAWFAASCRFSHGLPATASRSGGSRRVSVLIALYRMHLLAQAEHLWRSSKEPDLVDITLFHLNGLALFDGLYILFDRMLPAHTAIVALALAAWSGALAVMSRRISREAPAQGLALAFGMAGFAIGLQFDDWWAVVGWAAEATAIMWTGTHHPPRVDAAWRRRPADGGAGPAHRRRVLRNASRLHGGVESEGRIDPGDRGDDLPARATSTGGRARTSQGEGENATSRAW